MTVIGMVVVFVCFIKQSGFPPRWWGNFLMRRWKRQVGEEIGDERDGRGSRRVMEETSE